MTQSAQYGEVWSHVRDTQFGDSRSAAHELFHICKVEFQPPSKAHVKRVLRTRASVVPARAEKALDAAYVRHNLILRHVKKFRDAGASQRILDRPVLPKAAEPAPVVIAGLLTYQPRPVPVVIPRLEPDYRVAKRLQYVLATTYGPLTRQQQAEAAFTLALYGDIIYAG